MTYPQLLEVAAKFGHEIPNNFRDTEPPMSEYPPMSENRTVETIEKEGDMFEQVIALILLKNKIYLDVPRTPFQLHKASKQQL